MREILRMSTGPDGRLLARHEFALCGVRFLALHYDISCRDWGLGCREPLVRGRWVHYHVFMASSARRPSVGDVLLRDVEESDLPFFFEHQLDPEATRMAAFSARDRKAFLAH